MEETEEGSGSTAAASATERVLDPARHPTLAGVERAFFDHWIRHVADPDDPHLQRWVDWEETAVERATASVARIGAHRKVAGAEVLDIGCQNGAMLIALARAGAEAHGIDVVEEAIEASAVRGRAWGFEVDARVGDASALEFPDDSFDIVYSSDVFEHVPDKQAMLREGCRVLRPGGLMVIHAPQRFSVRSLMRDPHYQHPGLSILPGSAAAWVNRRIFRESVYEVETLPTGVWTRRQLQRLGVRLDDSYPAGVRGLAKTAIDELRQGFELYGYVD